MIYITGDTHGNIDFPRLKNYFDKKYVTRKDYLIILGDAGMVWSNEECFINDYAWLGPTVLFVDGNHENFELLDMFPIVEYKGARCHRLCANVFHILRGEIIHINGLSFFCMGGASSIDKFQRINRISWWEEENISNKDILNGLNNLDKVNYHVDYVLSHSAPSFVVKKMFGYDTDDNTDILEKFESQIDFKRWYFGHYHENKKWGKYRCFYGDILEMSVMDEGRKKVRYPLLTRVSDFDDYHDYPFLRNRKTGRKTSLVEEDLPEWYYHNYSYRDWYYCLKGVTDVAFVRSWTDNHLDKDASVYLHYHGKLKKNELYEPTNRDEWDSSVWRGFSKKVCLGLEKYSPHLDLRKLKAAINLNYDHYNQRDELIEFKKSEDVVERPFPEIETPHYSDKHSGEKAKYSVYYDKTILSDFLELEKAINYAELYLTKKLGIDIYQEADGSDRSDFVKAYDAVKEWIYVKKIEKE